MNSHLTVSKNAIRVPGGRLVVAGLIFLAAALGALAQQTPHLAYVYPAGGKAGTTFQVTVGGQNLMTVSNTFISGPGFTAAVLDRNRPMNQKEFNDFRDEYRALEERARAARGRNPGTNTWTAADAREMLDLRSRILRNPPNRTANPAMIDTVTVKITIAAGTTPGDYEIRLGSPNMLSNPMRFCVGTLPEVTKAAAKPANPDLEKFLERIGGPAAPVGTPKYEAKVSLPAAINGQIMPGGVDRYRFFAMQNQQLIIAASARSLIPYLADAVPGWFEPVLTVYDAKGRELACEERFRFKPDPVMHFVAPHDGEYILEIHDSIFRGREDFVYRLALGQLPFVTSVFPLGGRAGEKTAVTLSGWNLTESQLTQDNSTEAPGVIALAGNFFNPVPFAVDDLPECLASGSNHAAKTAQAVTLPVIINGRISQSGVGDVYQFTGTAGQKIVAEVYARRLDSPLDSFLRLTDATGQSLAFNDDFEDKGTGLNTHHADSYLTATLPAEGTYFVDLTDTQAQGGPEFAYRLRISEPRPDFALRIVPSSLNLRTGMSGPATVYALRRDGFTNAITLSLKDAPKGFSLSGAQIATNQDKAQFTVKAPAQPTDRPVNLTMEGRAVMAGPALVHPAVPAEDLMQAFFYRHLVPSKELAVWAAGPERPFMRDAFKILSATPVKIAPGGAVHVRVSAPAGNFTGRFTLQLNNPPEGILLTNVSVSAGSLDLVFSCDAGVNPGLSGNLICDVVPKNIAPEKTPKKGAQPRKLAAVATLPAVPYTIAAP